MTGVDRFIVVSRIAWRFLMVSFSGQSAGARIVRAAASMHVRVLCAGGRAVWSSQPPGARPLPISSRFSAHGAVAPAGGVRRALTGNSRHLPHVCARAPILRVSHLCYMLAASCYFRCHLH